MKRSKAQAYVSRLLLRGEESRIHHKLSYVQRLRLATYLDKGRRANARTLLIFDEPTVGLHMQDVAQLIEAMHILVRMKASVIVIEHNLDFIAHAHHVIELGPDAGPKGGEIVFEGSPKDLFKDGHSLTSVAMNREFSGDAV